MYICFAYLAFWYGNDYLILRHTQNGNRFFLPSWAKFIDKAILRPCLHVGLTACFVSVVDHNAVSVNNGIQSSALQQKIQRWNIASKNQISWAGWTATSLVKMADCKEIKAAGYSLKSVAATLTSKIIVPRLQVAPIACVLLIFTEWKSSSYMILFVLLWSLCAIMSC